MRKQLAAAAMLLSFVGVLDAQDPPPYLKPDEALKKMNVVDGFEVTMFAAEPDVTQPMAFCFDPRGRMWVAENRNYEERGKGFSAGGPSRILIFEDVDGDGRFDKRKVFLDDIVFPAAIAVGYGGLWVGSPPNLVFVPDRDGDDRPDGPAQIKLDGWGIRDRHEVINSFVWGPDGWLYGCHGVFTESFVGKPVDGGKIARSGDPHPGLQREGREGINGGVWRYHPIKDRFEVFAHGFSNPWGLDFDTHGQAFLTACVIPHLWHVIQGGYYHRQSGRHYHPFVYNDIKTITDHKHKSAHGGARFYLADAFPPRYHGRLFMANMHQHEVLTDIMERRGSGFVGHHGDDFLQANDEQWIGFSIELGPAGEVYVLDWHDSDICGRKVLHKDTGRIYRLAWKGARRAGELDLAKRSDADLVNLQLHANDWYVRHARVLLHQRAADGNLSSATHAALWKQFNEQPKVDRKLRALWCLHLTGGATAGDLTRLLDHDDEYIRAWAIQLLCEDRDPPAAAVTRFAAMAKDDRSQVVRLYLASALQRLPVERRWDISERLIAHAEDANDHNLPLMYWYGVEPLVAADKVRSLQLATTSKIPVIRQYIARRSAETDVSAIGSEGRVPPLVAQPGKN